MSTHIDHQPYQRPDKNPGSTEEFARVMRWRIENGGPAVYEGPAAPLDELDAQDIVPRVVVKDNE